MKKLKRAARKGRQQLIFVQKQNVIYPNLFSE